MYCSGTEKGGIPIRYDIERYHNPKDFYIKGAWERFFDRFDSFAENIGVAITIILFIPWTVIWCVGIIGFIIGTLYLIIDILTKVVHLFEHLIRLLP